MLPRYSFAFLITAPLAAVTACDDVDVAIVGGGWAGLAAAYEVSKNGTGGTKNFVILEARNRLGGRSVTLDGYFKPGYPVEVGSAWTYQGSVHYRLANWEDIPVAETLFQDLQNFGLYGSPSNAYEGPLSAGEVDKLLYENYKKTFIPFANSEASSTKSVQEIIDEHLASPECQSFCDASNPQCCFAENSADGNRQIINGMIASTFSAEFGAPMHDLASEDPIWLLHRGGGNSVRWKNNQVWYTAVQGGGYDKIIDVLINTEMDPPLDQNTQLKLNTEVTEVNVVPDGVELNTKNTFDSTTKCYKAKAVIITVPLPILQEWVDDEKFIPPLPPDKVIAITDEIGMGNLNKCIMYWNVDTSPSWWPDGEVDLQLLTDQDIGSGDWTYVFNDQSQKGNEDYFVLTAWIGGDAADYWETESDEDIMNYVLDNLKTMLGNVDTPTAYLITRWRDGPYSKYFKGAYTYNRAGKDSYAARTMLARTEHERLFFAGEATSLVWYGTVVGAYKSGEEAAWAVRQSKLI